MTPTRIPEDSARVPGGVVQEVHQHLDDAAPVRHDAGQVRLQVDVDRVPGSSAEEGVPGLVHQDGGVRGFGGHRQSPGLDAGHVQEVGDEGAHLVGLLFNDPEEEEHLGRVQRFRGTGQGGCGTLDGVQRGPQFRG